MININQKFIYKKHIQGFKDLSKELRYKFWTFGDDNTITMGLQKSRIEDEGEYKVSFGLLEIIIQSTWNSKSPEWRMREKIR